MKPRLAIVCSSGGMRCSYAAGVLAAFGKESGLQEPDILIAASGSAGTALYYLAGQYQSIFDIWTKLLSTRRFIWFLRLWRIMDIDYLIDQVFKKQAPLDTAALSQVATRYYFPVVHDKGVSYLTNFDEQDIFEKLRAAKAVPFVYGKSVSVNGIRYSDAAFKVSFDQLLQKARSLGAEKIIGIDSRINFKQRRRARVSDDTFLFSNTGIPTHALTNDGPRLRSTFQMGYEDAVQNDSRLKIWLNEKTAR